APEQAPRREHRAPKYAVLPDRLDRITRTAGLVLAAPGNRRRDEPLVDRDRSDRHGASGARKTRRGCLARACVRRRSHRLSSAGCSSAASATSQSPALAISSVRDASTPDSPSRSTSSAADGLATTTTSCPGLSSASACANAWRSIRLTRLRSTAPPTFRDTDRPRRGRCAEGFGNVYSTRCRLAVERP